MVCLLVYRKRLGELHASLASTFEEDFHDEELRSIVMSPLASFYRPSLILSVTGCAIMAIYWITPLIMIIVQYAKYGHVAKYFLPFATAYPWRVDSNPWIYSFHYIFEVYAGVCLVFVTSGVDSLFGYYIFQISGQFRALSHRIRNLNSRENYRKVISECVNRHQILVQCQVHLERIYGPIVLWLSVTSAMVMCALIYQASHINPAKAVSIVLYILLKSTQILLYGWFGTLLSIENDSFRESIYASDWPGSGEKHLMKDVLIMITYNRPFVLRACSVSTISVDMFVAVSNTALSYYFMIRTLEEGHKS